MNVNELPPELFKKAYEKWAIDEPYYDWWDSVYDMKKEDGKELGFDIKNIYFSGFWSQGDGACWEGNVNVMKIMEKMPDKFTPHEHIVMQQAVLSELFAWDAPHISIIGGGRYSHSETMEANEIELSSFCYTEDQEVTEGPFMGMKYKDFYGLLCPVVESAQKTCLEQAKEFANDIYKTLEKEYEYLTSEECFKETAEANEYEFDEEGELV